MFKKFRNPKKLVSDLCILIDQDECEYLDFKLEYHKFNVDLIHDILCLSNAYTNSDRYLVFGVQDGTKEVIGVQNDPNRKKSNHIQNLLSQSYFNRVPTVSLRTIYYSPSYNIEVDVLIIANRPDKPFFLTQDKEGKKGGKLKTIRAGVIYTRLGDINTRLDSSAQEFQIDLMWRERFGIGLSPLEKAKFLLKKYDEWVSVDDDRQIYHKEFPEFTIREGRIKKEDFQEKWTERFDKITAESFEVELRFFDTILEKKEFVRCDGKQFQIPLPEIDEQTGKYYILADSVEYNIAQIFWQRYPIHYALKTAGIEIRFESLFMKAKLIAKSKEIYDDGSITEIIIWELPDPIPPSTHKYKYRLYYGREGRCFVRYDNERGKGDHKHINSMEINYSFVNINQLLDDFEKDIENWSTS